MAIIKSYFFQMDFHSDDNIEADILLLTSKYTSFLILI